MPPAFISLTVDVSFLFSKRSKMYKIIWIVQINQHYFPFISQNYNLVVSWYLCRKRCTILIDMNVDSMQLWKFTYFLWPSYSWPYCHISGGFHGILQRVRIAKRRRLLLQTPGPVLFGTCIVLMLRPFFPEFVTDLRTFWVSNIPRYFSVASQ